MSREETGRRGVDSTKRHHLSGTIGDVVHYSHWSSKMHVDSILPCVEQCKGVGWGGRRRWR